MDCRQGIFRTKKTIVGITKVTTNPQKKGFDLDKWLDSVVPDTKIEQQTPDTKKKKPSVPSGVSNLLAISPHQQSGGTIDDHISADQPTGNYRSPNQVMGNGDIKSTNLLDIVKASKDKNFVSPNIQTPNKIETTGKPLDYNLGVPAPQLKGITSPGLALDLIKNKEREGNYVTDAPTSREVDPITKKIAQYLMAIPNASVYGMQGAGDKIEQRRDYFKQG